VPCLGLAWGGDHDASRNTGEMREKDHILLETRLTHLHWAEGLILLVAAIGVSLSLGGRFIASFERDRMDGV
jgi:hypothetical protein